MGFASGRPVDAIDRVVTRLRHAAREGVKAAAMRTLARARELAPTDTGELKASGRVEIRPDGAAIPPPTGSMIGQREHGRRVDEDHDSSGSSRRPAIASANHLS